MKSGLAFLPMSITIIVVAGVGSAVLVLRVSSRILIPSGMLLGAVGMSFLTRIDISGNYLTSILPGTIILGAGLGLVFAPAYSLATLGVSDADSGVASATANTSQQVGGSVGTALFDTLAATVVTNYVMARSHGKPSAALVAHASLHSYHTVFGLAVGVFVIGAVVTASLLRSGVPEMGSEPRMAAMH